MKPLVRLTEAIVREKEKKEEETEDDLKWLDERLLRSPSIAISECNNISGHMARLAEENLMTALSLFDNFDEEAVSKIKEVEDKLDRYEDRLGTYLVKLSPMAVSAQDSRVISKILHTIGDFERLGDHAVNLFYAASEINRKGLSFTPAAKKEIDVLSDAIREILTMTHECYVTADPELAFRVEPLEQVIDKLTTTIKTNHIARLQKGGCSIEMGFILSDMLTNFKRISDHCSNIAVAVIEVDKGAFDTHEYLSGVKFGNLDFNRIYDAFDKKYAIEES